MNAPEPSSMRSMIPTGIPTRKAIFVEESSPLLGADDCGVCRTDFSDRDDRIGQRRLSFGLRGDECEG